MTEDISRNGARGRRVRFQLPEMNDRFQEDQDVMNRPNYDNMYNNQGYPNVRYNNQRYPGNTIQRYPGNTIQRHSSRRYQRYINRGYQSYSDIGYQSNYNQGFRTPALMNNTYFPSNNQYDINFEENIPRRRFNNISNLSRMKRSRSVENIMMNSNRSELNDDWFDTQDEPRRQRSRRSHCNQFSERSWGLDVGSTDNIPTTSSDEPNSQIFDLMEDFKSKSSLINQSIYSLNKCLACRCFMLTKAELKHHLKSRLHKVALDKWLSGLSGNVIKNEQDRAQACADQWSLIRHVMKDFTAIGNTIIDEPPVQPKRRENWPDDFDLLD